MSTASAIGLFPKAIEQEDNQTFSILWTDGEKFFYPLVQLQLCCPCANCMDEERKGRKSNAPHVQSDVRADWVRSVGHYGLKVTFTSGCSNGIFSYPYLYQLGQAFRKVVT